MTEAEHLKKPYWLIRYRNAALIVGPLLVLVVIGIFFVIGGRYVTTDDAYVQAARTDISTSVSGRVTRIFVTDNQPVKKGDALFTLDARPFLIAVEEAKAQLANSRLQIEAAKATYRQRQADRHAAADTRAYRKTELNRQVKLVASGISSQAQLDQAAHAYAMAREQLNSSTQESDHALADLNGDAEIDVDLHPLVQKAKAQLDLANLNLTYATVVAPADGVVTKVGQLQVGEYVNAAAPLFSLISNRDIWIDANFKETDLTYLRPGQSATVEVDTYSGKKWAASVTSLSPGTGSSFSILPPENATGNWVKVVQRLPVRLTLDQIDPMMPLHVGMSVQATVDTQHHRTLF